jgi:DNA-directed RNA polymerase subunit L
MEIRIIDTSSQSLEIEVLGENETLLNALKVKLLEDDAVDLAEYIIEHPDLANPKVYIRTQKGDPVAALKRALKGLHKDYKDLEKALDAATPEDLKKPATAIRAAKE